MKPYGDTDLKRLHREWRRRTEGRVAVLLDRVQQPFNVGAVIRTAAALRADHLWLVGATAPPPTSAKVGRVSLGTERYLPWTMVDEVAEAVAGVGAAGFSLVGVELAAGAVPLHEARLAGDVCLALGHEDRGLSSECLEACDEVVFVPQLGKVGSLNVAHAAAIALYEVRRRAWT